MNKKAKPNKGKNVDMGGVVNRRGIEGREMGGRERVFMISHISYDTVRLDE